MRKALVGNSLYALHAIMPPIQCEGPGATAKPWFETIGKLQTHPLSLSLSLSLILSLLFLALLLLSLSLSLSLSLLLLLLFYHRTTRASIIS